VPNIDDVGDDAFAWQMCELDDRLHDAWRSSTGFHTPATGSGTQVSWQPRSAVDGQPTDDLRYVNDWDSGDDGLPRGRGYELLRTVSGVRALFDFDAEVHDPVADTMAPAAVAHAPGSGLPALRFEGVPMGWPKGIPPYNEVEGPVYVPYGSAEASALRSLGDYQITVPWLLDVWASADDPAEVTSIRFQTQEMVRTWRELRFVPVDDVISGGDLVKPQCPTGFDSDFDQELWHGYQTWQATMATPLDVLLDSDGRPYEFRPYDPQATSSRSHAGQLTVPDGELTVVDGIAGPYIDEAGVLSDPQVAVAPDAIGDDGRHLVNVDILWDHSLGGKNLLAVWLGPTDAEVEQWDPLEYAYGTDGGMGAVMTTSLAREFDTVLVDEAVLDNWIEFDDWFEFVDLDDAEGYDVFKFSNGVGDGGFPMARGRDASGDVVAVVIFHYGVPWRLAVPEGTPPPEIVNREEEILECLSGTRPVLPDGQCESDSVEN
jgi:hypothetical protein